MEVTVISCTHRGRRGERVWQVRRRDKRPGVEMRDAWHKKCVKEGEKEERGKSSDTHETESAVVFVLFF